MALPIVGKCIVLPVLLLFFYVTNGFRIRDFGQASAIEQRDACTLDRSKCQDAESMTNQLSSISGKKGRIDAGGVSSISRIKFGTIRGVRKSEVDVKENNRDDSKYLKNIEYSKTKFKMKVDRKNIGDEKDRNDDKDNDDDDDDDDVIIEDEEEFNEIINEDENKKEKNDLPITIEDNNDVSVEDDDKNDSEDGDDEESDNDMHDENDDKDVASKGNSIFKRIDVRREVNTDMDRDERMRNEKMPVEKAIETSVGKKEKSKHKIHESLDNNNNGNYDDENDADIEIIKSTVSSKKREHTVVSEISELPLRKLEKVRLADKDKVKPIEDAIVKSTEDKSRNNEWIEKTTIDAEDVIPKNDKVSSSIEGKSNEKRPAQELNRKNEEKKPVDQPIKESAAKKVVTKEVNVKPIVVDAKIQKQLQSKEKNKSKDSDTNKDTVKKKVNSIVSNKQPEISISLSKLNDEILRLPNFVPNFTAVENPVCQQHGKIFLRQLRGYKLWALQMMDSGAKIPSGLLRGNVNQLGDYDECLGISARVKIEEKTVKVQGKYCLANIDLYALISDMKIPVSLIQSRNFLRGTMHETGHFVPKFTTINWALCLPAVCSAADAQLAVSSALNYLNTTTGLKFLVNVDPDMCYVHQKAQNYSKETIAVLYFYAMIFCLVLIATMRDFLFITEKKGNYSERIIMSFSLRRTMKILMKPGRDDSGDINCIHGIRSLATIALYVAHKMIPIAGMPYSNRIVLTEIANNPLSSLLRVSIIYTDSFLLLSGVLSAYNMSKESETRGEIRWFCRLVARFIRLTPALLVIIFWYAYVMEHTGSGPQWHIMKKNADLCKQNSWTNLLYIQNFFPFEEMCATHTHQLALDMQLSLLAPILVFFLQVKPVIGILLIFFLLQVSATLRYFATVNNYLSLVIFHGMTAKHLYKIANLTYAVSIHRITPYIFGTGLGVLLHYTGKNVKIYRIFIIFGWIVALLLGAWSVFSPWPMARRDYVYNAESNAHYAVLGPVAWSLALCWSIFACFTNSTGIINKLLSNSWLIVFSRISYAVYLTQFAVFFYNLASTRYSSEFQLHRAIDIYEVLIIIFVSTILTLFFDIPMQEVKCVLMECTDINIVKDNSTNVPVDNFEMRSKTPMNQEHSLDENPEQIEIKKQNDKLKLSIVPDFYDEKSDMQSWKLIRDECETENHERRRSKSGQRNYIDTDTRMHRESTPTHYQDDIQRGRRSLSRSIESNLKQSNNRDDFLESKRDRHEETKRERSGKLSQKPQIRLMSSGSEDELLQRRGKSVRRPIERPRVSDEEDWEQELRIRRRRFMERMAAEVQDSKSENENIPDTIMRRSSAEGKIALLTGSTGCRGMDAWTVSHGPRISITGGSSQELSENEEDLCLTGDYEQSEEENRINVLPVLMPTEEEDKYDMELDRVRPTRMDHGQSPQDGNFEQNAGHLLRSDITKPVATGKLFKRESIIKSQASEEDPEYLLPERPKLIEQEQEHPFKKAWQMQKSRSEEDGSSAFIIREVQVQQSESNQMEKRSSSPPPSPPINQATTQAFQLVVEDVDLNSQQTKHEISEDIILDENVEQSIHDSDDIKLAECTDVDKEASKVDECFEKEEIDEPKIDQPQLESLKCSENTS